jgi:phenylalanyl-tRNA synthetase beta chain
MRFSIDWLREFIDIVVPPAELAARLTAAGFEVGGWEEDAAGGAGPVLEIDITANRPDAMNHFGLAREIAAILGLPLRVPSFGLEEAAEPAASAASVAVEAADLCPRYVGRVVTGLRVAESPAWLKSRLTAIGLAPKNNLVDASNYVLFELGQPLHTFDLARLGGRGVLVRRARAGETIVTVADRESRKLTEGMLVIGEAGANGRPGRPAAIAGVMGGLDTAIGERTREVLVESAWFDPASVRRTARTLGLHSDASHRFERGADPGMTLFAADRLAALLAELGGGRVLAGALDVQAGTVAAAAGDARSSEAEDGGSVRARTTAGAGEVAREERGPRERTGAASASRRFEPAWRPEPLSLRPRRLTAVLGIEAAPERIVATLKPLAIELHPEAAGGSSGTPPARAARRAAATVPAPVRESDEGPALAFRIPTWRADITREEDLIEEYARLSGYDAIPETLPAALLPPRMKESEDRRGRTEDRARARLAALGYREVINYAMVSRSMDATLGPLPGADTDPFAIGNPLSDRWEVMRRSLLPGLAETLAFNLARGRFDLRIFEIASVHGRGPGDRPREIPVAGIGAAGSFNDVGWPARARPCGRWRPSPPRSAAGGRNRRPAGRARGERSPSLRPARRRPAGAAGPRRTPAETEPRPGPSTLASRSRSWRRDAPSAEAAGCCRRSRSSSRSSGPSSSPRSLSRASSTGRIASCSPRSRS